MREPQFVNRVRKYAGPRLFLFTLACTTAALAIALPAFANAKPITGTRIALFQPPTTFPANTPFHIEQGSACLLSDATCLATALSANDQFSLSVDGALQPSTVDVDVNRSTGTIRKLYLTNFPAGLPAGSHSFVGVFFDDGVVTQTVSITISFT